MVYFSKRYRIIIICYGVAITGFFLFGILSCIIYPIPYGFLTAGFFFGITFLLCPCIKSEHKIGLLFISPLAYVAAVSATFLPLDPDFFFTVFKRIGLNSTYHTHFFINGIVGGAFLSLYLYYININIVYIFAVILLSMSLSAFFSIAHYPLVDYRTPFFELCYPWVVWQMGVGLAIVYAYRNTFPEVDSNNEG